MTLKTESAETVVNFPCCFDAAESRQLDLLHGSLMQCASEPGINLDSAAMEKGFSLLVEKVARRSPAAEFNNAGDWQGSIAEISGQGIFIGLENLKDPARRMEFQLDAAGSFMYGSCCGTGEIPVFTFRMEQDAAHTRMLIGTGEARESRNLPGINVQWTRQLPATMYEPSAEWDHVLNSLSNGLAGLALLSSAVAIGNKICHAQSAGVPVAGTCHECGKEFGDGAKFCIRCGRKFDRSNENRCPGCQSVYKSGQKFCRVCGYRLSSGVTK